MARAKLKDKGREVDIEDQTMTGDECAKRAAEYLKKIRQDEPNQ